MSTQTSRPIIEPLICRVCYKIDDGNSIFIRCDCGSVTFCSLECKSQQGIHDCNDIDDKLLEIVWNKSNQWIKDKFVPFINKNKIPPGMGIHIVTNDLSTSNSEIIIPMEELIEMMVAHKYNIDQVPQCNVTIYMETVIGNKCATSIMGLKL